MCKINLSTGEVRPTIDLDALLEDVEAPIVRTVTPVRTATVHTQPVRTAIRTENPVRTDETVRTGRYDRMKDAYPERIEFRAKRGTKDMLKKEAERLGLSVTQLLKESVKEYLKNH